MKYVGLFVVIIALCVGIALLFAWPFMWLWNYAVVAALATAQPIGFWHAFCLMWIVSLAFGSLKQSS